MEMENAEKIYVDINPDNPVTEVESFCVNCEKNGVTRILITKIPFFKEIILMAFHCDHCGYKSSEVQPGQCLSDHGINFELMVNSQKDLNRRVIKSEYATIKVPDCDLEIPPNTQKGKLTTIEGFLTTTKEQLENALNEGVYDEFPVESKEKIIALVSKLDDVVNLKQLPVKFIIDDPSGNSFIENPFAPQTDPYIKVTFYERTKEMAESMGYMVQPEDNLTPKESNGMNELNELNENKIDNKREFVNPSYYDKKKDFSVYKSTSKISAHLLDFTQSIQNDENNNIREEALTFPANCYCCNTPGENYMCLITIPYFKELIIICFKCQQCGYKTTEVKGGGGMCEKATRLTLKVETSEDYDRDVFKSETAMIRIPELEFETDTGSMGSMFTTVEGILEKLISSLNDTPFTQGDSSESIEFDKFIKKLQAMTRDRTPFTLIIDDAISNSFIHSPYFPEEDPRLLKEEYERSWEQNDELGINDMKTENYAEDHQNKLDEENK